MHNSTASSVLEAGSTVPLKPSSSRPPPTSSGDFEPLATSTESPPKGINPNPIQMDTSGILPLPVAAPTPGPSRPDTSIPPTPGPSRPDTSVPPDSSRAKKKSGHAKKVILKHRPKKYDQPTLEDFTRPRTDNVIPLPRYNLPSFPELPLPVPALPAPDQQNPVEDSSTPRQSPERNPQPPRMPHHKLTAKRKEVTPPQSPPNNKQPRQLPLREREQTSSKAPSCSSLYRTAQEINEQTENEVAQEEQAQDWRNILLIGEMSQEDQQTARNIEQDLADQDSIIEQAVIATDFKSRLTNTRLLHFSPRNSPDTTPQTDQVQNENDDSDTDIASEFHPDRMEIPEIRVISEDEGVEEDSQQVPEAYPDQQEEEPEDVPRQPQEHLPPPPQQDSIDDLLGPSTETSTNSMEDEDAGIMEDDEDPRANDLSRSNVMSQSSVIVIESSQDGDTSNEMGTRSDRSDMSTEQTPPDPPTPLGALDHLNRQESALPPSPQPQQQEEVQPPSPQLEEAHPAAPIIMAAPLVRVQNPDLVMFNVADTITAPATIRETQPDPNLTPEQVLLEVDLNYNLHHVLTFRENYPPETIVEAWFDGRVVIEDNDEGFQTSQLSALDSQPSISIEEFRLAADFSRLNANLSSTNATAGSSQSSTEALANLPSGRQETLDTPDSSVEEQQVPALVISEEEGEEETPEEEGEKRGGPRE